MTRRSLDAFICGGGREALTPQRRRFLTIVWTAVLRNVRRVIVRQREFATFGRSFLVLALHEPMHRIHVTDALRASGRTALAADAVD